MGPLDIWMILAGWLGLLLPLPSLWWAWHRWANEARGRTSHDRTYRITLVSLGTASLAVACWIAAVLCFFKHRTMPFDVCETGWAVPTMSLLCVLTIVSAWFGLKRCRWTTIFCAIGVILYSLSFGVARV